MRAIVILLIIWFFGVFSLSGQSSTSYDVEFSRICLIDSIAPDTLTQFWRFTQANNPGGITRDYTYDLAGGYIVSGTVVPCCSCLTAASDKATAGPIWWKWTIWGTLSLVGLYLAGLILFWGWLHFDPDSFRRIENAVSRLNTFLQRNLKRSRFACTIFFLTLGLVSQGNAQSETLYDVEFSQICLIDSIAPDTIVQFWRFTHANNPGGITRDFTYDLSGAYIPTGTVLGCNDYYLGDNPEGSGTAGTLAIWTGTETLGNSSLTESAEEAVWNLTGSLTVPSGTDAEVPVWGAGKLRYNTTAGGFQGGPSGYYIPWANADNWVNGYIPYSNGNLLEASSNLQYLNNEFRVGGVADQGGFKIQAGTSFWFGNPNSGGANFSYGGTGPAISYKEVLSQSGGSTARFGFETNNTASGSYGAIRAQSTVGTALWAIMPTSTNTGRYVFNVSDHSDDSYSIRFSTRSPNLAPQSAAYDKQYYIDWEYYRTAGGVTGSWIGNRLIVGNDNGTIDKRETKYDFRLRLSNEDEDVTALFLTGANMGRVGIFTDSATAVLDVNGDIRGRSYGSGTITGTATQNAAFDANGKVIERAFAFAEMSIDDANPDTISITSGVPAEGTDWTQGELSNFTYSAGRLTYTGTETAKFLVNSSISFSFSVVSSVVECWVYKNGAEVTKSEMHRKIGTGGDVGNGGQTCILELATNDYIEIFFDADNNGNVIIQNANVNLVKI